MARVLKSVTKDITGCARCHGEGHAGLEFEELTYPIEVGTHTRGGVETTLSATHWAPCPTNGQPILMSFITLPDGPIVCDR